MKKEEIHLTDIHRLIFGEAKPEYILEVTLKALVIYFALLLTLRLLGKRMGGQITLTEMAVMISLGAVIAPPMQMPDKGILICLTILVCIYFLQRGITLLTVRFKRAEEIIQGVERVLVKDGVLDVGEMMKSRISRHQLFAVLREKGLHNLGQVKRVYLEACGLFSVYLADEPVEGLSILPATDEEIHASTEVPMLSLACETCGKLRPPHLVRGHCENCHSQSWTMAIV